MKVVIDSTVMYGASVGLADEKGLEAAPHIGKPAAASMPSFFPQLLPSLPALAPCLPLTTLPLALVPLA